MTERLTFDYVNEAETAKVVRTWEKVNDSTVRETDSEYYRNHETGEWDLAHEFTRCYEIDSGERLVGDGSNWSGEGKLWYDHAEERHNTLLELRFPHDFGESPVRPGTDKRLVKDIAARNA